MSKRLSTEPDPHRIFLGDVPETLNHWWDLSRPFFFEFNGQGARIVVLKQNIFMARPGAKIVEMLFDCWIL